MQRSTRTFDKAVEKLINEKGNSLVCAVKLPHNFHPSKLMRVNQNGVIESLESNTNIQRRQDVEKLYARNGAAIYIFSYDLIMKKNKIIGDKCIPYIMNKLDSIDIDDLEDFKLVELILK